MSTRDQIEADAALARRLQEEEYASPPERFNPAIFPGNRAVPPPPRMGMPQPHGHHPGEPRPRVGASMGGGPRGMGAGGPRAFHQGREESAAGDVLTDLFRRRREAHAMFGRRGMRGGMMGVEDFEHARMGGGVMHGEFGGMRGRGMDVMDVIAEAFLGRDGRRGGGQGVGEGDARYGEAVRMGMPMRGERVGGQGMGGERLGGERYGDGRVAGQGMGEQRRREFGGWQQEQRAFEQAERRETGPYEMHENGGRQQQAVRDVGEMFNAIFADMIAMDGRGRGFVVGGGAGMGVGLGGMGHIGEWLRNVMPDGGEPRQYEDWLDLIERMGGSSNRGASDAEIGRLPSEGFSKALFERNRRNRLRRDGVNERAGSSSGGARGMDETSGGNEEAEKCAICLGEFEDGDMVKTLPCYHLFHTECVDRWLKVNKTCPFCKKSIREEDGECKE